MKKKFLSAVITMALVLCLVFTACFMTACDGTGSGLFTNPGDNLNGGGTAEEPDSVDTGETASDVTSAGSVDLDTLEGDTSYDGATTLSDEAVSITKDGTYYVTGTHTSVTISKKLTVHLVLDGATIENPDGIAIESGKNCEITLTLLNDNTVSTTCEDTNAIHIKGNLSVNGSGTLTVNSSDKSAIKVSKTFKAVSATLNLNAASHGITAETIAAEDATINVTYAGKDGLHAECDYDEPDDASECVFTLEKGFVSLSNVTYTASTMGDGIQADTFVYVDGGTYNITTTGVFVAKSDENMEEYGLEEDDFRYIKQGNVYEKVASDYTGRSTMYALQQGCKGIKVGEIEYLATEDATEETMVTEDCQYTIMLVDGTFTIDSTDDAIHCNSGDVYISGGTYTISTSDDGVTSDGLTKISGGEVTITDCYEGLEGAYVEITDGTVNIEADDDGINAASDDESVTEYIIISGGDITVNAQGDGIDSNGSVLITGGRVVVYGPTNGGNGGLDSETGVLVKGGTLFVTSALGMVETPGQNSTQYVLSLATQTSLSSRKVITVEDSDGNELFSTTLQSSCQSIIISLPDFVKNSTYYVYSDGTQIASFTPTSILTYVGTSSSQMSGGMGGGSQPGRR